MGGKGRIVNEILPIMLSSYDGNTFIDIFCGGCSVIEHVPNTYRRIANDKQKYLIAMWRALTTGVIPPMHIERDYYCDVRDSYNKNNENYFPNMIYMDTVLQDDNIDDEIILNKVNNTSINPPISPSIVTNLV